MQHPSRRGVYPYDLEMQQAVDGMCPVKLAGENRWTWVQPVDVAANNAQTWLGSIDYAPQVDGTVPAGNTVTATAATAFSSTYAFFSNSLKVGSLIRVRARGVYGTAAIPPTLQIRLLVGGVVMLATTVFTTTASLTNAGWALEADLIVTVIGAGGQFEAQGQLLVGNVASNAKGGDILMLVNTAAVARATNSANAITIDAKFGAANAANTITLRTFIVEIVNP